MLRIRWNASAAIMALCATCLAADGPGYQIVLNRGLVAGSEYDIQCDIERTQTLTDLSTPNAKPVSATKKMSLTARMKVLAVDPAGAARKMTLTVSKLVDEQNHELLPAGTEVDIQRGEKETQFTGKNGLPIDAAAAAALDLRYFPGAVSKVSTDDTFGSQTPRKIGESWPMNADLYRKVWVELGWKIDAGALTGGVRLEALEKIQDVPMLRITTHLEIKNATPPDMPADMQVLSSELTLRSDASLPVDVSSRDNIQRDYFDSVLHVQDKASKKESIREVHGSLVETIAPVKVSP